MTMNLKKNVQLSFVADEASAVLLDPSGESVEEVVAKFMKVSLKEETKKRVDQWAIMRRRITKAQEQLEKLREENPNSIHGCLFGCEKIMEFHFDEMNIGDLCFVVHKSLNELTRRIDYFEENGEFSYLPPHYDDPNAVVDADTDADAVTDADANADVDTDADADVDVVAGIIRNQTRLYENIYLKMCENMHAFQENVPGDIPSLDDSHHQISSADLATTDNMSSVTTTPADVCAPNITNNP